MRALLADLHYAIRSLRRRPGYLVTCAGTLALVLGANAATLAVVNATILRPLPFAAGDRVVHLHMQPPGTSDVASRNPLQQMDVVRLRERAAMLRRIEGYLPGERAIAGADGPVAVPGARVTPGLLDMLQVRAAHGRVFRPEEGEPGHDVAIVTHAYWQGALGGREVLGSTLVVDGVPHTIVGITPPDFPPPFLAGSVLTPLVASREAAPRNPLRSVVAFAELADGVTAAQANDAMAALVGQLADELPATHSGWSGGAEPARTWLFGQARTPALVLFAASGLVLLIAAANITNLTTAQATARSVELSLRTALGASRADLLRLQVAELMVVAIAGAVPGLAIAAWAVPALLALHPVAAQTLGTVSIDARVQALTLWLGLAVAAGAAVVPTWVTARRDAAASLSEGTLRLTGARRGYRTRRVLVAAQVALCLALLMASALVLEGLRRAGRVAPGFEPAGVLTAQLRLPGEVYDTTERRADLVARLLPRLRALPGVDAAATTMNEFVPGNFFQTQFHLDGRPTPDGQPRTSGFSRVSPDYFRAMRMPVVRGRTFTDQDGTTAPAVAVLSRALAAELFPGEDAVGRVLRRTAAGSPATTVVGVVEDAREVSLAQPPQPTLYLPWAQNNSNAVPVTIVLRTSGDPAGLTSAVRGVVRELDASLPLRRVRLLDAFLTDSVAPQRFRTTVLGVVAGLGLVLAALGVYGVVSRAVVERRAEFAVRLALGAGARRLVGRVLWTSLIDVVAGILAGALVGGWTVTVLARVLEGVAADAWWPALGAATVLGLVAAASAAVPALAVIRVAPGEVLHAR